MIESEPSLFHVYQPIRGIVSNAPSQCYLSFDSILAKDYPKEKFGFDNRILNMECIDMDEWEISKGGNHDNTMDCALLLSHYNVHTASLYSPRCLLVEFKLGIKNFNLSKSDLGRKNSHSRVMLAPHNIHPSTVFVLPDKYTGKADYQCRQWKRGSGGNLYKNFKFVNPIKFNTLIKFCNDFPYKPINDPTSIENDLVNFHTQLDYEGLGDRLEKWKDSYLNYLYQGNTQECINIKSAVNRALASIVLIINDSVNKEYFELVAWEWQNL